MECGFVPAIEVRSGMHVRGRFKNWRTVKGAESFPGMLQDVSIGGEVFTVDVDHRWLAPRGDPLDPIHSRSWITQSQVRVGTLLQAFDSIVKVDSVSDAYPSSYRKIELDAPDHVYLLGQSGLQVHNTSLF